MLQHNRSETFSEKFISRRCQSMFVFRLNTRSDINCLPNGFSIVSAHIFVYLASGYYHWQ